MMLGLNPLQILIAYGVCMLVSAICQLIYQYGARYLEKVDPLVPRPAVTYRTQKFSEASAHTLMLALVFAFIHTLMHEF